ncbi:NCS2 family permease [Halarsenatibacter silvermanii]|uniref:Putative MFS transporter, AGZA family, xanthine/uracil permease n=1 Tax=Halarsenatibacter silvermanii TaxID=321763 RepID=A0A1G9I948_9FIRM|nr:NCS2 family permease [Halarsenatibacter silvermanii]SDL21767.1 putative MFS transporter, AGZA family, xanthine/uracil permease [Halarsenatibacter silvermanii]
MANNQQSTEEGGFLDDIFNLSQNDTDVKTEFIAGLTTFMTMAYIIFVNPDILESAGMPFEGVFIATIAGIILGTLAMAFLTNYPFALASGMGLNAFFAYSVVIGMGVAWEVALGIIFLEGILFILLSVSHVRKQLVNGIPMSLKIGISAGIGLFIVFIGFQNAEYVVLDEATMVAFGSFVEGPALVATVGLVIAGVLYSMQVKGALLFAILGATVFGFIPGVTPVPDAVVQMPTMGDWGGVLMQLDLSAVFDAGLIAVILSFLFVDLFDTAGTLVGLSQQAGYLDEDGNLPKANRALLADAIGTTGGALFGTSTVTTYIESASGVEEGGRTGLTGVFVALLFFLSLFFMPIVGMVPSAATAPALIIVGVMMTSNVTDLDWDDYTEIIPAFLTMVTMPFAYSISHGIAVGFVVYPLLKLFTGRKDETNVLSWVLFVVFILYFVFLE